MAALPLRIQIPRYQISGLATANDPWLPTPYAEAMQAARRRMMDWADEQFYGTRPTPQGDTTMAMTDCPEPASPPQVGINQFLTEMNELAESLFHKLDVIHDQFIGSQPSGASVGVATGPGLIGRSVELRDRLYRCHEVVDMIRACVDGG